MNLAPVLPYEVPTAALAVISPVAGEKFVEREKMQKMPRVHHVLPIARVWRPRLSSPIAFCLRIFPHVRPQHPLEAVGKHLADAPAHFRVAAHPNRNGGISGKGDVVSLREYSMLRSTDIPPFALFIVVQGSGDMLKPCEPGKLVGGERTDARHICRVGRRFLQEFGYGTAIWTREKKRGKENRKAHEDRAGDARCQPRTLCRQEEQPRREGENHDLLQGRHKRRERDDLQRMKDEGKSHRGNRQD